MDTTTTHTVEHVAVSALPRESAGGAASAGCGCGDRCGCESALEPETDPGALAADEALAALFKAFAHPARLRIFRRLCRCDERACGEIVDDLPLSQSTVSEHLRILRASGLVQVRTDGRKRCYCVSRNVLERFKRLVAVL